MEKYTTLCFKTEKQAVKNEAAIKSYFEKRLISSEIKGGRDERGNEGYYIKYTITKTDQ